MQFGRFLFPFRKDLHSAPRKPEQSAPKRPCEITVVCSQDDVKTIETLMLQHSGNFVGNMPVFSRVSLPRQLVQLKLRVLQGIPERGDIQRLITRLYLERSVRSAGWTIGAQTV